jgi:hypothetical protein
MDITFIYLMSGLPFKKNPPTIQKKSMIFGALSANACGKVPQQTP